MHHRISIALLASLVTVLAAAGVSAQPAAAPDSHEQPGWTGISHPADLIDARRRLMDELEQLMRPIDSHAADEPADADTDVSASPGADARADSRAEQSRAAAATIAALLATVPHLFPPTTDRYDSDAEIPQTLALPAIWQDFDAFYRLAVASVAAADTLAAADTAAVQQASVMLRASCDACHALYLRPWEPAGVSSEDLEFDFDAIFAPD